MVASEPILPPPGWYVDPNGQWRWWGGAEWKSFVADTTTDDSYRIFGR